MAAHRTGYPSYGGHAVSRLGSYHRRRTQGRARGNPAGRFVMGGRIGRPPSAFFEHAAAALDPERELPGVERSPSDAAQHTSSKRSQCREHRKAENPSSNQLVDPCRTRGNFGLSPSPCRQRTPRARLGLNSGPSPASSRRGLSASACSGARRTHEARTPRRRPAAGRYGPARPRHRRDVRAPGRGGLVVRRVAPVPGDGSAPEMQLKPANPNCTRPAEDIDIVGKVLWTVRRA